MTLDYLDANLLLTLCNFLICTAIGFICICRWNAMEDDTRWSVRMEYGCVMSAAVASGLSRIWWDEWASWGQTLMGGFFLVSLICSGRGWRGDVQPVGTTEPAPLSDYPAER